MEKSIFAVAVLVLTIVLFLPVPGFAAWEQKTVNAVAEKIKTNQKVLENDTYPKDQVQMVSFQAGAGGVALINYVIDIKAKLCFASMGSSGNSFTTVPCKALKEGYPVMAPLITWE